MRLSSGRKLWIFNGALPLCNDVHNAPYYQPLVSCISGTTSNRWIPIQNRSSGPHLSSAELEGVQPEDFFEDTQVWRSSLRNYWSLLSPIIFSDHPKRPGDEDPTPPYNMVGLLIHFLSYLIVVLLVSCMTGVSHSPHTPEHMTCFMLMGSSHISVQRDAA
ncbi:SAM-DEPENDENT METHYLTRANSFERASE [Salix purpurea]|uniref:SAM-DEPENDENT METHYLTRANSFERASE n=1 Tax=Salix purpurea TaxID=77065 RepID=A0A9Q0TV12_SALPP|nr:SAM-DEPENDENT METHYLTRANSFERASE [Salix purpurea]